MPNQIIIIAGVALSGKRVVASKLSRECGINRTSGDALISALESSFPDSAIAHQGDDREKAKAFFPVLFKLVENLHKEAAPFVIDTAKLLPEDGAKLIKDLDAQVLFLGYPNIDLKVKLEAVRAHPRADDWTKTIPDETMLDMLSKISEWSRIHAKECETHGIPFYDTGENFEGAICAAATRAGLGLGPPAMKSAKPDGAKPS